MSDQKTIMTQGTFYDPHYPRRLYRFSCYGRTRFGCVCIADWKVADPARFHRPSGLPSSSVPWALADRMRLREAGSLIKADHGPPPELNRRRVRNSHQDGGREPEKHAEIVCIQLLIR